MDNGMVCQQTDFEPILREKLGNAARENAKRFLPDKVMTKWIDLFNQLAAR